MWNNYMNYLVKDVTEFIADNVDALRLYNDSQIDSAIILETEFYANTGEAVAFLMKTTSSLSAIVETASAIQHLTLAARGQQLLERVLNAAGQYQDYIKSKGYHCSKSGFHNERAPLPPGCRVIKSVKHPHRYEVIYENGRHIKWASTLNG